MAGEAMTDSFLTPVPEDRSVLSGPPTSADRVAIGRAVRERAPLEGLAEWDPATRRADALSIVLGQNESRIARLIPLRMARMAISPWTYYRGAAAVMASDLAGFTNTGLAVQLCGDAHVLNFGLWATPERQLSFDLRDFDETLRGPFEWDVKRYLASLVVLARDNGLSEGTARRALQSGLRAYRTGMSHYASSGILEIWYDLVTAGDLLQVFEPEERERVSARLEKRARRRTSAGAARKLTRVVDGRTRIVDDPPIRVRLDGKVSDEDSAAFASEIVQAYRDSLPYERRYLLDRFTFVDVVRQVVGVGSVGMQVYLVLLEGRGPDDPLFLQIKQAGPSVYEQYLGPSPYPNHGQRVITGKRLIQAASDIFVGWTRVRELDFYVRQFRDMKVIADGQTITPYLVHFAGQCGAVLARAHARSGDPVAISSYIGKGRRFDRAMIAFATRYADQTARDHEQLVGAVGSGSTS
jgi:uncharacterized protein (DUF2252 family)